MSDTPPDETPKWLDAYLDAGRDVPDLASDAEARMLARLVAGVGGGGAGGGEGGAPPASAAAVTAGASTLKLVTTGVIGLVLGTAIGVISHATLSEPEIRVVERVVEARAGVPTPVEVSEPPPPPPSPAPSSSPALAHTSTRPDASVPRSVVDASARAEEDAGAVRTRDEALADENALITRAQSALARGRASEALEAVHVHEREFPRGRFVEEREVLAIKALARLGRSEQATARAERFYRRFPSSMLTRVVRSAVGTP